MIVRCLFLANQERARIKHHHKVVTAYSAKTVKLTKELRLKLIHRIFRGQLP